MALHHSPSIVTDSLVSYLDAANVKSYPGSGTTWYDVSGNGNHGTLVNSPTFNSTSGGNFVLNGSNQWVTAPLTKTASCTFSLWAKAVNVTQPMLFIAGNTNSGPDLFFYTGVIAWNTWDGVGNQLGSIPASATNGFFHNYVLVNDSGSNTAKLYYDGSLLGSSTYKSAAATTVYTIGGDPSYLWNGSIAVSMVHNKALSIIEVQRNFNALRNRYGI